MTSAETMFRDLYDYISLMFSGRWPKVEGVITAVDLQHTPHRTGTSDRLVVAYEFSLGDDGPYTGESTWSPCAGQVEIADVNEKLPVGLSVAVRYRPDDPSVNRLDHSVWQEFEGL